MADEQVPAAQDDADDGQPAADAPESSPAAILESEPYKQLRDRHAQQGRELAQTRQLLASQAEQLATLQAQLGQVNARLQADEQARTEAYLQTLPPDQRAIELTKIQARRIEQLEQQVAGKGQPMPSRTPAAPAPAETEEQYKQRRSREILELVADETGIRLSGQEDELDWESESAFRASARALAKAARKSQAAPAAEPQAVSKSQEPPVSKKPTVSAPLSPKPVPNPKNEPISGATMSKMLTDTAKLGPRERTKRLEALREQAAVQVR